MYKIYEKVMSILLNIITIGYYRMVVISIQHDMTKAYSNKTKHVTFKEAKKYVDEHIDEIKANKIELYGNGNGYGFEINDPKGNDNSSKYWSDIVIFYGVGYLFNSWGWLKMQHYMNKILK